MEPHGRTLRVTPGQPILQAALSAGLNLPHSCKSGHCGSCRARLLAGAIHYPDGPPLGITAEEVGRGDILLCQARADSDLTVRARLIASVADVEIKTLPCRIARLTPLAPDVMQLWLRLPAVERLRFHPGQYLDVLLENGRRRSFSIASPPHDSEALELHVRRVNGGGFSERLFGAAAGVGSLGTGALLRIEGPIGQFSYREGLGPVLMVAGGTGFAPLKSMLRHMLETGIRRDLHLYWGARHTQDVYEEALVLEWVRRHPQLKFTAVLSEASAAEAAHHRAGWVHEAVLADYPELARFEVYAAGPPAMIEAMRTHFPRHGLSTERLYFDSFDYAPDARPPPAAS
ncbi:MAG: 2Fe-2S iron-sulfur cluster binding domain-containing protein [Gammaproteobacteria bacterium]|nr:MAG: 2Fe-2S iron-sulfur cluster binding domain-containing protein [Gammaproteobacteria bacterium]TLZ52209.1 MAG: 2Fe-2S iron-sulfur cluster binding domain-containing protein [Gammaproteobacteria bacterium]TMH44960.1 MAG: 2Fe-2S iron-sulfur cluster binding domain-containing protein [Betaproteobacteria bacterium]